MGIINIRLRFLVTSTGGRGNVIKNEYMKISVVLAMGYFLYWVVDPCVFFICSLYFFECQQYFLLKCKQTQYFLTKSFKLKI